MATTDFTEKHQILRDDEVMFSLTPVVESNLPVVFGQLIVGNNTKFDVFHAGWQ